MRHLPVEHRHVDEDGVTIVEVGVGLDDFSFMLGLIAGLVGGLVLGVGLTVVVVVLWL